MGRHLSAHAKFLRQQAHYQRIEMENSMAAERTMPIAKTAAPVPRLEARDVAEIARAANRLLHT